ncbi:hypothetical protein D3C76_1718100 [compost metagenome]
MVAAPHIPKNTERKVILGRLNSSMGFLSVIFPCSQTKPLSTGMKNGESNIPTAVTETEK